MFGNFVKVGLMVSAMVASSAFGASDGLYHYSERELATMSSVDTTYPGKCTSNDDCTEMGADGYVCISVDTNRAGLSGTSQCVPKNGTNTVCSGTSYGLCPCFSSWPSEYREIAPVCAYTHPSNCDASGNSSVDCISLEEENGSTIEVIYACIDEPLYLEGSLDIDYENTTEACASTSNDSTNALCNGHGTCVSSSQGSLDYTCMCNAGYTEEDGCYNATSNTCSLPGQCGIYGDCDLDALECVCDDGVTGNQCSECDPTSNSSNVCSGHGSCGIDGACTCDDGYNGTFCQTDEATGKDVSDEDGSGSNGAASFSVVSGLAMGAASIIAVALF